jgi:hypothetical protein
MAKMSSLTRVLGVETTAEEVNDILNSEGAVVVEGAAEPDMLASLNADLDRFVEDLGAGLRHPVDDIFVDFYGTSTVRFDGLPVKSPTFLEVMQLPLLQNVADLLLKPYCEDYLLNTGQLIEIRPGETTQPIHRDPSRSWKPPLGTRPCAGARRGFAS